MHCRCLALSAAVALIAAFAPAASAQEGASNCTGKLADAGSSWQNECELPFQGFPIGVAGVYDSNPAGVPNPPYVEAEIHVELQAVLTTGTRQPLGVECDTVTTGIARCQLESNFDTTDFTSPAAVPTEIASIICSSHSHARFTRFNPPSGNFACWSTAEARQALVEDKWFEDNGFGSAPPPEPEPGPGPLDPLSGAGVSSTVTTVPFNTYAPKTLVVSRSLGLKYVNFDTARHDVVALEAKRQNTTASWCTTFDEGTCPLFWTPLIPGGGTETPVLGLKDTKVGESYRFYCTIHPYMVGDLQVAE